MPRTRGFVLNRCRCGIPIVKPGLCGFCREQRGELVVQPALEAMVRRSQWNRFMVAIERAGAVSPRNGGKGSVQI